MKLVSFNDPKSEDGTFTPLIRALINGVKVPSSLLGSLKETSFKNKSDEQLRYSLNNDGYLLLRDVIDKNSITKALVILFLSITSLSKR